MPAVICWRAPTAWRGHTGAGWRGSTSDASSVLTARIVARARTAVAGRCAGVSVSLTASACSLNWYPKTKERWRMPPENDVPLLAQSNLAAWISEAKRTAKTLSSDDLADVIVV